MNWKACRDNIYAFILCVAFFFVSIAIVLGSGVLALPVSVGECGFWPFMITFVIGYFAQIYVITFMMDLLQITEQAQFLEKAKRKKSREESRNIELEDVENNDTIKKPDEQNEKLLKEEAKLEEEEEEEEEEEDTIEIDGTNEVEEEGGEELISDDQEEEEIEEPITAVNFLSDENEVFASMKGEDMFSEKDEDIEIEASVTTTTEESQNQTERKKKKVKLYDYDDDDEKIKFMSKGPDLFSMGQMFIPKEMKWLYDVAIVVNFVSILTSYSLAGPQCIGKFINYMGFMEDTSFPLYYFLILPFVCLFSTIVILGARCIAFIITGFTIFKGSALLFVLFLTGIVTLSSNNEERVGENWNRVMSPFLIGTVALSGIFSIMPVVYCRLPLGDRDLSSSLSSSVSTTTKLTKKNKKYEERKSVVGHGCSIFENLCRYVCCCFPVCDRRAVYLRMFKISAILGLTAVTSLNIAWVIEILILVPQSDLEHARKNELISTVPLMDAVRRTRKSYDWISYVIDTFVLLSVSVSFICEGSGFKHYVDGIIRGIDLHRDFENGKEAMERENKKNKSFFIRALVKLQYKTWICRKCNPKVILQWSLYVFIFSVVYILAQFNPKTFFFFIEIFNSFAGNLMCGVYLAIMIVNAYRKHIFGKKEDRVNMFIKNSMLTNLMIIPLFIYFTIAILYDVIKGGVEIIVFFVNMSRAEEELIRNPF